MTALAHQVGLARVRVTDGVHTLADVGDRTAIAAGTAPVSVAGNSAPISVTASELTAPQYKRDLAGPGVAVVVREGPRSARRSRARAGWRCLPAARSALAVPSTES